tara:strand:- start:858 stop:1469 length:612 start_codon:yes stop_codon:yes gene_type:complete
LNKVLIIILFGVFYGPISAESINKNNLFEFLNSKQHITAQFTQITSLASKERKIQGKLMANRSGQFKIEYFEPIREMISADGNFLYKLDIELEQLDIVPQEDYFEGTPINLFTSSLEDLDKSYSVTSCTKLNDIITCIIKPKTEESFLEKLSISFKRDELLYIQYSDSFEQTVRLNFEKLLWSEFDESDLVLSIPEGIDVVYH